MSAADTAHQGLAPSPWVTRWVRLLAPGSRVLDVACGFGRHTRSAAGQGHHVVAIDKNEAALSGLKTLDGVRTIKADLEEEDWPVPGNRFDAVIVTNYLHRPLFPALLGAVSESGLLIYETFARGNEKFGRPSNPDFLLEAGELIDLVRPSMHVLGYEDVYVGSPQPAMVQRICSCGPRFIWPASNS